MVCTLTPTLFHAGLCTRSPARARRRVRAAVETARYERRQACLRRLPTRPPPMLFRRGGESPEGDSVLLVRANSFAASAAGRAFRLCVQSERCRRGKTPDVESRSHASRATRNGGLPDSNPPWGALGVAKHGFATPNDVLATTISGFFKSAAVSRPRYRRGLADAGLPAMPGCAGVSTRGRLLPAVRTALPQGRRRLLFCRAGWRGSRCGGAGPHLRSEGTAGAAP